MDLSIEGLSNLKNLSKKDFVDKIRKFANPYKITEGKKFKLKDFDTNVHGKMNKEEKSLAEEALQVGVEALAEMQEKMYAQDKWSLLIIFQAMDAAGKDGAIKHVMSGVNPQGCRVNSFKAPSNEELDHDFLWRCIKHLPERGCIGIFNRSYYEEVLVVRVHEQILHAQKMPKKLITKNIWDDRLKDIRHFEEYLNRNGTLVVKFFLNVSSDEQKKRFIERIDEPDKNWKFSIGDAKERKYWKDYMHAYDELIRNTATEDSPWYVVPADNKAYARMVVAAAIIEALHSMDLQFPKVSQEKVEELKNLKIELLSED